MVKRKESFAKLINRTFIRVRFNEVDSMSIVWHGEYVKYFEDGREAFGREFDGIGYMDIANSGYFAPMVELNLKYKKPLKINDTAIVETRFIDSPAAKICFEYKIIRESDNQVVATGNSVQVFTSGNGDLELLPPPFFIKWKDKWIK